MARIELEKLGENVTVVSTTKGRIWFSYCTPVAILFYEGGRKYRRPNGFYSRTTAKHLGIYCYGFEVLDNEAFEQMLEEVA